MNDAENQMTQQHCVVTCHLRSSEMELLSRTNLVS